VTDVYAPNPFASNPDRQSSVGISYLLKDPRTPFFGLTSRIASDLLLAGPSTPMYKALILSGLGPNYSAQTGYDNSTSEASFGVGLKVWIYFC
jgi:Zn-dependent M16 (insulinase) family peptidase